jgi:hypothetical protein
MVTGHTGRPAVSIRYPLLTRAYGFAIAVLFSAVFLVPVAGVLLRGDVAGFVLLLLLTAVLWGPVWCFTIASLRTRFTITDRGLVICNGFRTVEVRWRDVFLCGGIIALSHNSSVLGLPEGDGGDLVVIGRHRRLTRPESKRLGSPWCLGQAHVFEFERERFAGTPLAEESLIARLHVRGVRDMWSRSLGGLLIVSASGDAWFANAVRGGWFFRRRIRRRFASVLRAIERARPA